MMRRAILALLLLGLLAHASGASVSLARYTDAATADADLRVGAWFFLHNDPTPPTADTPARTDLAMDAVVPLAATLHNYSRNMDGLPGRSLLPVATPSPAEKGKTEMVNWQSPPTLVPLVLGSTVEIRVWTAVDAFQLGQPGALVAHLRDYDPVARQYVEIATVSVSDSDWQQGRSDWVETRITAPLPSHTLPIGHQLELKLQAGPTAAAPMRVAYDTSAYPAALALGR